MHLLTYASEQTTHVIDAGVAHQVSFWLQKPHLMHQRHSLIGSFVDEVRGTFVGEVLVHCQV